MRTSTVITINGDDTVEHRDGFTADDPGAIWILNPERTARLAIMASSVEAAALLVAAAIALRDRIALDYRPACDLQPGWLIELPGMEHGDRVRHTTPKAGGEGRLIIRTAGNVREVAIDALVRVIDEGVDEDCGHVECHDADGGREPFCVHDAQEAGVS